MKRPITERQISFVTNVVRKARMEFSSKSVFLLAMETAWDDNPTAQCPRCNALHIDYDGFGVLYCEHCGYCRHPSVTAGVCELCGKPQGDKQCPTE